MRQSVCVGLMLSWFLFSVEAFEQKGDEVQKWAQAFEPSVLSLSQRKEEFTWFHDVSAELSNQRLYVVGEANEATYYESQFLSRVFEEITGISVTYDVVDREELIARLYTQLERGVEEYDAFLIDGNLLSTFVPQGKFVSLTQYMKNEGKSSLSPYLDLDDFDFLSASQLPKGELWQLPGFSYPVVYWFRYDWFSNPELQASFEAQYDYPLGVPVNWAAYADIAEFFHGRALRNPNDTEVDAEGHADFTLITQTHLPRLAGGLLAIAGLVKSDSTQLSGSSGIDSWGLALSEGVGRTEDHHIVYHALAFWQSLFEHYLAEKYTQQSWLEHGRHLAAGKVAQSWYWTPAYYPKVKAYRLLSSPVTSRDGDPVWRTAPLPKGPAWKNGSAKGYRLSGNWTMPSSLTPDKKRAVWLWMQFVTSKSVALKKFQVSQSYVRESTLHSDLATSLDTALGGLVKLLRTFDEDAMLTESLEIHDYQTTVDQWWQIENTLITQLTPPRDVVSKLIETLNESRLNASELSAPPLFKEERGKTIDYRQLEQALEHQ
ncbi:ABC transporter substrate-binding protein [Thaumasiovibrio subtropicus]|uniref:ABC transporter substrate-binding protein n=1 Tax=Thaumasiovibrio subtropicus TaxID=1891207 RepID=UPI00131B7DA3|nr:extracellular solute-binding protein [Thaumasiovibrio subtropicus]